jgi:hypothetical protein
MAAATVFKVVPTPIVKRTRVVVVQAPSKNVTMLVGTGTLQTTAVSKTLLTTVSAALTTFVKRTIANSE